MTHGHGERRVGPLLGVQPQIGKLCHLRIVRGDRHDLGAVVARLDKEMRVGGARLRHVRAPGDDVGRIVPIGRFRHVGLLAPGLRARRRQIAVPVVERQQGPADQRQITRARGVGHHRHRRDRREPDDAVRPPGLDRRDVGRGDDLGHLVPRRTDKAAASAQALIAARPVGILDDRAPSRDRVHGPARLAPQPHQRPAHHRVFEAAGAVEIPAVRGAARAAARLVVGHVGAGAGVIGLLRLPGDDPALDVDLPAARAGAIDAVGRAHDLVVLPALAVALFPFAVFAADLAEPAGERLPRAGEIGEPVQEVAHASSPDFNPSTPRRVKGATIGAPTRASPITGSRLTSVR